MIRGMGTSLTFLVASPHLRGDPFEKSVILLLEHNQERAFGLIVNAPTSQKTSELIPDLTSHNDEKVWLGGPVEPTAGWCLYRHPVKLEGEIGITENLTVSSSMDVLHAVVESGQDYMLVLGYAGWGSGQLANEAREGTWLWVDQDTPELIWDVNVEERWSEAVDRLGVNPDTIVPGGAQA